MVALFHPFTDRHGVDVDATIYGGGLKEVRQQVETHNVTWDVVDFELPEAAAACREGLLERIGDMELPPGANGVRADRDFVPEAIGPCWIGSAVYSQVIAYDGSRFPMGLATAADFFNLAQFPGGRGLKDTGPQYTLELALLADGVPPGRVYATLGTREGADRAFAKLDTIKPAIVWWHRLDDALSALDDGKVTMTTALNGKVYDALKAGKPIGVLWTNQLYQLDVFGIPKGSPNKKLAMDFIRFATAPDQLAAQSRWVPYGPARRSAVPLIGANEETGAIMRPYLPTAPENFIDALAVDPDWWAVHGAALQARWDDWRRQAPAEPH
jgi:putative spermidine/putrescine transport system substrate-binding protein